MDRDHILAVVIKHFRKNVDLPPDLVVDPTKSMLDQGAQSLDLLEIVSATMRELQIKIPRTKLRELKNINELVDCLYANRPAEGK
jgi:acyl carrier protein